MIAFKINIAYAGMVYISMRPRYLEIEGLQSFKERQAVDFDTLSETGLFGIFGPTGSGKSTVLDAITLALYGTVQRAVRGTQGIINTDSGNLRVAFRFDLLKGRSRTTYRVERIYRRRKDSGNSSEARAARLVEERAELDYPLADKPGEVTAKVVELLGLQPEDFMRSVVLPQNKFQEFLMLEKAKKREMLERIFYLEEYGRQLTERVNRKLGRVRNTLAGIEGAMSALGDASEKALIESEGRMKAAREHKERLDAEQKRLELEFNEAKNVWELVTELGRIAEKEKEHLLRSDETDVKRQRFENSLKARGLMDYIGKFRETERNLAATIQALEDVDRRLPAIGKEAMEAAAGYAAAVEASYVEKPKLIEQRAMLNDALKLKGEAAGVDARLTALRETYLRLKEEIAAKESETAGLRQELEASERKEAENEKTLEGLKVGVDYRNEMLEGSRYEDELKNVELEKEKQLQAQKGLLSRISELEQALLRAEEKHGGVLETLRKLEDECEELERTRPGDRNEILKELENYHHLRGIAEALKLNKSGIDTLEATLNELRIREEQQKEKLAAAIRYRNSLDAGLAEKRGQVEELGNRMLKNSAFMLAAGLREGEPCPVCGSTRHPAPASQPGVAQHPEQPEQLSYLQAKDVEKLFKTAKEQLEELEKECRTAETDCIKLDEQLKSLAVQISGTSRELKQKNAECDCRKGELPGNLQEIGLEKLDMALEAVKKGSEEKLKGIEVWEASLEKVKSDITEANRSVSARLAEVNTLETELKIKRENLGQAEILFADAERDYRQKLERHRAFIEKHKIRDVRSEMKRLEENDRRAEKLQRELENIRGSCRTLRGRLELLRDEQSKLGSTLAEVENDGKNLRERKREMEKKILELSGGMDIETGLKAVHERLQFLEAAEKQTAECVKVLEGRLNDVKTEKSKLENQKQIFSLSLTGEKTRLDRMLEERGFASMDAAEAAILPIEQQEALERDIREYEQNGRNLLARREMVQRKLDSRSISEEEWQRTCSEYEAVKPAWEESLKAFEAARLTYQSIKENFEKWVELDLNRRDSGRKQEMLEQIQKLLKGNSFVEYIAEERLRYIAREASDTLGILTRQRYALEIDTENGFVIRDFANGGAIRMVSSLSGGETFLTSLSLALALSKQIQLKGQSPLEFFFLDEGFGTLDANLLDTVVDALERLSSEERVIGLISHVPELKNRIARRLVVEPPALSGRGSRVYLERA